MKKLLLLFVVSFIYADNEVYVDQVGATFNLDIEQQLLQDLYIEEEEDVGFTIQKFPGVTL